MIHKTPPNDNAQKTKVQNKKTFDNSSNFMFQNESFNNNAFAKSAEMTQETFRTNSSSTNLRMRSAPHLPSLAHSDKEPNSEEPHRPVIRPCGLKQVYHRRRRQEPFQAAAGGQLMLLRLVQRSTTSSMRTVHMKRIHTKSVTSLRTKVMTNI